MCSQATQTCTAHAALHACQNGRLQQYAEELKAQRAELELKVRHLTLQLQQQQVLEVQLQQPSRTASETSSFSPLTEAATGLQVGQVRGLVDAAASSQSHCMDYDPEATKAWT